MTFRKSSLSTIPRESKKNYLNPNAIGRNFELFSRERFTANKLKNIINFRSLALFFSSFDNKHGLCYRGHLCKLRHHKKVLENFRKFIPQERHIRISTQGVVLYFYRMPIRFIIEILIFIYDFTVILLKIFHKNDNRHLCSSKKFLG